MSRVFELFTGEFVRITLIRNHKQSVEHRGALKVIESPMIVEGYLTDEDTKYFFLGAETGTIAVAVDKNQMSTMEIVDPNEAQESILESFIEGSENKEGMN